jgi:hypothetical protein
LENKMLVLAMQFSRSLERAPTAISGAGTPQKKGADWSETTMNAPLAGPRTVYPENGTEVAWLPPAPSWRCKHLRQVGD